MPGRDRADDEQPAEARVAVAGRDLPVAQRAAEAARRSAPSRSRKKPKQDERGRQVRRDQEGQEVVVVLVDVPAEQPRQDDGVPEARDRERLGDPLEEPQDDRLEVGDRVHAGDARSPS